jgi:hypothetical protein
MPSMPTDFDGIKRKKIRRVLREFRDGKLTSTDGSPVTERRQAVTLAISEARREAGRPSLRRKPFAL